MVKNDSFTESHDDSPGGLPENPPAGVTEQRSRFTRLDHMAITEEANNLGDDLLIDHQPSVDKPSDPGPWPSQHTE